MTCFDSYLRHPRSYQKKPPTLYFWCKQKGGENMATVVGISESNFTTKEGTEVSGMRIFLTEKIAPERGEGVSVDSVFVSKAKYEALEASLSVGDEVIVYYNKYGRVQNIVLSNAMIDY